MAFETIKAEIAALLDDTVQPPHDLHAVYQKVLQEINDMKAFGMPLPADLVELERSLEEKFSHELGQ